MPLVDRALKYPGITLCAACAAFFVSISLIASQHVGVNLAVGLDFESISADVEFSSAAGEGDKKTGARLGAPEPEDTGADAASDDADGDEGDDSEDE